MWAELRGISPIFVVTTVVILSCAAVLGCQRGVETPPIPTSPPPTSQPPLPAPMPAPAPISEPTSSNVLVNYHRSGGIAGVQDRLTVYYDGRCELQRKRGQREFTLEPDYLGRLKSLLEKANFPTLKEEYLTPVGADLMDLIITYQAEGKKYTVHTDDIAIPDALQPVIVELNQIIAERS